MIADPANPLHVLSRIIFVTMSNLVESHLFQSNSLKGEPEFYPMLGIRMSAGHYDSCVDRIANSIYKFLISKLFNRNVSLST